MNSPEAQQPENDEEGVNSEAEDACDETIALPNETATELSTDSRSDPQEWVGRRLGKYEITGVLGIGGMGVVLKGYDASIERDVAIKVLPNEFSTDEVALGRFLAEAKSAGQLSHTNTVTIYEIAQEGPTHYLAMEVEDRRCRLAE